MIFVDELLASVLLVHFWIEFVQVLLRFSLGTSTGCIKQIDLTAIPLV